MNTTKIVFIGAGSMSFGLSMFRDVFSSQELAGSTFTLVDTNRENLSHMTQLAQLMSQNSGAGLKIVSTTNRRSAMDGAVSAFYKLSLWRTWGFGDCRHPP